jgi:outer membrane murein-binding lipoprotein Lpp
MTRTTRFALAAVILSASSLAGTGGAQATDRLQKLLQIETLNRMASDAAPTKKNRPSDDGTHQDHDHDADRRTSSPEPYNRRAPGGPPQ